MALILHTDTEASDVRVMLSGRGVWVQSPAGFDIAALSDLRRMGVRRMHIMVTGDPRRRGDCQQIKRPSFTAGRAKLNAIVAESVRQGFHVIATVWVAPSREAIDILTAPTGVLNEMLGAGAAGLEFDIEGPWALTTPCGFVSHAEAGAYLLKRARDMRPGIPVGVTTHVARAQNLKIPISAADWLALQVYALCEPKCVDYAHPSLGPAAVGSRAKRAAKSYSGPIIIGLAAYQQQWPQRTVNEAMLDALRSVQQLQREHEHVVGHSYWSTFWVLRSAETRAFLESTSQ